MKNRTTTTVLAVFLHILLAGTLYGITKTDPPAGQTIADPQDKLLHSVNYTEQRASVSIYAQNAEIAINGRTYTLYCTPEQDQAGNWNALEAPTGNEVRVLENGTTVATIEGKQYTFFSEP